MTTNKPPLATANLIYFVAVHLLALVAAPLWALLVGFSGWAWLTAGLIWLFSGLSITAGYHRLWSHRSYQATWPLKLFFVIFGTFALQNSVLVWCARHRLHHRFVDDTERDPHSIRTGFWHAHIGWMLRHWPTSEIDFDQVKDLERDPLLRWQHRHYWLLTWLLNLGVPVLLGVLIGEVIGMVLLAGAVRLVFSQHCTFFINSLAHTWGKRHYTDSNTSRDNAWLALVTWGEGYHNFHHAFQADYRNGVCWWHFDPGKWLIAACSSVGLAGSLKRTPAFRIRRAKMTMQFRQLERELASGHASETWAEAIEREYQQFMDIVSQWQAVQAERVQAGTAAARDRWQRHKFRQRFRELDRTLKDQARRLACLQQQWHESSRDVV
ncbi:fatty acid desaturase [Wenzhouxiangella sp. AB-CW3]|uniref:acyl-CoA desaturase n=1 Tax=Wenzhouxiangella sp. AB-CW3 TaxID=2771012 RepID=UPI00168A8246|nr:fatty acid desaturase [Wenzhouxiangella sp. AB-CW3]QOC21993.1 fatty acid desaturase [Wenzhouxiangella sp. AB-CW3]